MELEEFEELFQAYMAKKRQDMRDKYDRVLPSGELIFNRFDKGEYLNTGKGSSIYDASVVFGDVEIGEHVWVGPFTVLDGSGGKLRIGDYVSINTGVQLYTHDSTKNYVSGGAVPFEYGEVTIGHNTIIGANSVVKCGVTIGNHCVVGAGSFVTRDVEDYTIVAGTPARQIGTVVVRENGDVEFDYHE